MNRGTILRRFIFSIIFVAGTATAADKPNILILATGGTIAGSAESQTQAGYTSGQVGVDILINAVPQIKEIANILDLTTGACKQAVFRAVKKMRIELRPLVTT